MMMPEGARCTKRCSAFGKEPALARVRDGLPHGDQERAGRMGTDAVGEGGGGSDVEVVLCFKFIRK